ncbi:MAG: DUF1822 family protein [Cyanobacteria bacterium P01_E01_bin.35]
MTNYNIAPNNYLLDFESFSTSGIELSPNQIEQAVALSDRIINPERQWQTYLNSLALFGFETWLQERDNALNLNSDHCSVKQPSYANYIDGGFNLIVGEYKLCLLTNGVTIDDLISVDRALIDLPEYAAHFYILINVVEEQAEVKIDRFISYQEIIQGKQNANLTADTDWTYEIPLEWFNAQPDDLLLSLRCLDSSTITLPARVTVTDNIHNIQHQLEPLLPQLQSGSTALHQILTWSQGAIILSNPDLLDWLYELQTNQFSITDSLTALGDRLSRIMAEVTQTAINVKSWLSNELDEIAQSLSWTLLPTPEFAPSAMRDLAVINRQSPAEEFAAIMTQLRTSGEDIPETARGACQDFTLASHGLRMYAVTWMVIVSEDVLEWSLLLILGAQPANYIPQGLKLELKEEDTVLDQKTITENTYDSYIYTQVIGELDEQFTVSVSLPDDTEFTFPKFVFN